MSDWVDDESVTYNNDWVDDPNPPQEDRPWYSVSPEGLKESFLQLPSNAAAMAAGLLNKVPAYGPALAGGAAVAGKSLEHGIRKLIDDPRAPKTRQEQYDQLAAAGLMGATGEMGGQLGGKLIDGAASGLRSLGDKTGKFAEKAALNATGATGKQVSEFSDDAGRELLDRKLIRFGDGQETIAKRVGGEVQKANQMIDDGLSGLDRQGVNLDLDEISLKLQDKIQQMRGDPTKADIVRNLETELDNIQNAIEARSSTEIGILDAEKLKRGYSRKAGNWADPEKGMAGKEMYGLFKNEVEGVGEAANPDLAALFREGKRAHGLFSPIQEAAERRAATTQQSPVGGLLDVASMGMEAASGGPGFIAPIARRLAFPRVSSSVAVGADKLSKILNSSPQKLGKYADVLRQAEARGPQGLAASHFILQQSNPEYRQVLQRAAEEEEP